MTTTRNTLAKHLVGRRIITADELAPSLLFGIGSTAMAILFVAQI